MSAHYIFSKDVGTTGDGTEASYGEVCDPLTLEPYPGLFVGDVHQEHGFVPIVDPAMFDRLPIGAQVRILPNHACVTAAAYDRYHVTEGDQIVEEWPRISGW